MNAADLLVPLLFLAVAGVVAYLKHKRGQQHTAELFAYATARGWRFSADDPYDLLDRWDGPPFDVGRSREVANVITTEIDGQALVAFEYTCVVGHGKHSHSETYSVVALGMPCALPGLHVAPEDILSRFGTALGVEDIDLESEDFNRLFRVRCPAPKFAHDVLTPRTMEALLAIGPVDLRFAGSDAINVAYGELWPDEIDARVHALRTLVAGVPPFVWRDRGVVA